jgi:hypothetical protein
MSPTPTCAKRQRREAPASVEGRERSALLRGSPCLSATQHAARPTPSMTSTPANPTAVEDTCFGTRTKEKTIPASIVATSIRTTMLSVICHCRRRRPIRRTKMTAPAAAAINTTKFVPVAPLVGLFGVDGDAVRRGEPRGFLGLSGLDVGAEQRQTAGKSPVDHDVPDGSSPYQSRFVATDGGIEEQRRRIDLATDGRHGVHMPDIGQECPVDPVGGHMGACGKMGRRPLGEGQRGRPHRSLVGTDEIAPRHIRPVGP